MLNCGYRDVDFICEELDTFHVDIGDIDIENIKDANSLIYQIYVLALANVGLDDYDGVSIFTNCLDSHLHINGQEMYSYEDLLQFKEKY